MQFLWYGAALGWIWEKMAGFRICWIQSQNPVQPKSKLS